MLSTLIWSNLKTFTKEQSQCTDPPLPLSKNWRGGGSLYTCYKEHGFTTVYMGFYKMSDFSPPRWSGAMVYESVDRTKRSSFSVMIQL